MSDVYDSDAYSRGKRLESIMSDIRALLEYRDANIRLQQKMAETSREHQSVLFAMEKKLAAKDEQIKQLENEKALAIREMRHVRDKSGRQVEKMRATVEFMRKWQNEEDVE